MSYISNYGGFVGILIWFLGGLDNLLLSLMIFVAVECLASALWFLSLYQFSIKSIVRWITNKCAIFLLIGIANTKSNHSSFASEKNRSLYLFFSSSNSAVSYMLTQGMPVSLRTVTFSAKFTAWSLLNVV